MIEYADRNDYIMAVATGGGGDDSVQGACGIAESHAYSLIEVFTMREANGNEHRMVLFRNPWAWHGYNGEWSPEDPRWTNDLVN